MEGNVYVSFRATDQPTFDSLVRPTLEACRDRGLHESEADTPVDPDQATLSDRNRLRLYWGTREVRFNFRVDDWSEPPDAILTVRTTANEFPPDDDEPADEYTGVAGDFVALIRDVAIELDPVYVATFNTIHGHGTPSPETVLTMDTPVEEELERIPWLGIYSAPFIEAFGGRERVLETPAWRVEELPTGSILIITTRRPWEGYREKLPADRYLLDGVDVDAATEGRAELESSAKADPFADLDAGAYGADVGVKPDDIQSEFHNEDLQLVRVYVDEDRNLRRVADDSFVRNVVDEAGDDVELVKGMLSDVPAGSTRETQLVSALIHRAIPSMFVRLDDPHADNVVTKVMDLDVDTSKYDLLVRLGDTTRHERFDEEALRTMEGALDTLADLEGVEGVERLIEEELL